MDLNAKPLANAPQSKPLRPPTKKEQQVVATYVSDPKITKQQAYLSAYKVRPNTTKESIASQTTQTFNKPTVKLELAKYSNRAEQILIENMEYSNNFARQGGHVGAAYATNARQGADSILDRVHGKAVQQIESKNLSVEVKLDLSGVRLGTHYEQIKPKQVESSN